MLSFNVTVAAVSFNELAGIDGVSTSRCFFLGSLTSELLSLPPSTSPAFVFCPGSMRPLSDNFNVPPPLLLSLSAVTAPPAEAAPETIDPPPAPPPVTADEGLTSLPALIDDAYTAAYELFMPFGALTVCAFAFEFFVEALLLFCCTNIALPPSTGDLELLLPVVVIGVVAVAIAALGVPDLGGKFTVSLSLVADGAFDDTEPVLSSTFFFASVELEVESDFSPIESTLVFVLGGPVVSVFDKLLAAPPSDFPSVAVFATVVFEVDEGDFRSTFVDFMLDAEFSDAVAAVVLVLDDADGSTTLVVEVIVLDVTEEEDVVDVLVVEVDEVVTDVEVAVVDVVADAGADAGEEESLVVLLLDDAGVDDDDEDDDEDEEEVVEVVVGVVEEPELLEDVIVEPVELLAVVVVVELLFDAPDEEESAVVDAVVVVVDIVVVVAVVEAFDDDDDDDDAPACEDVADDKCAAAERSRPPVFCCCSRCKRVVTPVVNESTMH